MSGPAGRIDAVLVCGGRWHDFDFARLELLQRLHADEHVRTRVLEDYGGIGRLEGVDALITYTCDVRPDAIAQQALVDYVGGGGRWLALHGTNSAIDAPAPGGPNVYRTPRALGEVAKVLGSQFLGHPPIAPYLVEVTQADRALVAGIDPFTVSDELYICELDEGLDVLLHTHFTASCPGFEEGHVTDDEIRPVLYLRPVGDGAVCYFTLGHCRGRFDMQDAGIEDLGCVDRGSWDSSAFRTILDRAIDWALRGEGAT
jgi:hypothetical protein